MEPLTMDLDNDSVALIFRDEGEGMSCKMLVRTPEPDSPLAGPALLVASAISLLFNEENKEFNDMLKNKIEEVFVPSGKVMQ